MESPTECRPREKLEATLKSGNADACDVGAQLLASQAVRTQLRAAKEALQQKFESVLTPEQKVKFEAFRAAREGGEGMMIRKPF